MGLGMSVQDLQRAFEELFKGHTTPLKGFKGITRSRVYKEPLFRVLQKELLFRVLQKELLCIFL